MDPLSLAVSLAQFAPTLMRFFGSGEQSVAVAEKAVALAQGITGKNDAQAAVAALTEDPELAQEYQLAVLAADNDMVTAFLGDRQNARNRDVALRQAGYANRRADWMVLMDVIGLVACLLVLIFFRQAIPGEVVGLLSSIASIFGLCLRDAHQFEFGSSRGSREKDVLLGGLGKGDKA